MKKLSTAILLFAFGVFGFSFFLVDKRIDKIEETLELNIIDLFSDNHSIFDNIKEDIKSNRKRLAGCEIIDCENYSSWDGCDRYPTSDIVEMLLTHLNLEIETIPEQDERIELKIKKRSSTE